MITYWFIPSAKLNQLCWLFVWGVREILFCYFPPFLTELCFKSPCCLGSLEGKSRNQFHDAIKKGFPLSALGQPVGRHATRLRWAIPLAQGPSFWSTQVRLTMPQDIIPVTGFQSDSSSSEVSARFPISSGTKKKREREGYIQVLRN